MFIWDELARLSELAHLGEMIFIPHCHGIFCLSSVKKFVISLEKDCLMSIFYNKQWRKATMRKKCSYTNYLINIWKKIINWLKKTLSHLAGLAHLRVFIWKIFISSRWNPSKIKWDPTMVGSRTSHMNTSYFYKGFVKTVRSKAGEPVHLTGQLTSMSST